MSDKDRLIAKLMKKESQLKEELQSMKDISTDTKSIQCDYWTKAGQCSLLLSINNLLLYRITI